MWRQDIVSLDATVERAEADFRRACGAYVAGAELEVDKLWCKVIDRSLRSGLSTRVIAEIAGCSVSSVSRWADGLTVPPLAARLWIRERLVERFERMEHQTPAETVRPRISAAAE